MVLLVDLDDDDAPSFHAPRAPSFIVDVKPVHHSIGGTAIEGTGNDDEEKQKVERHNPNINGFSAALSCYPVVRQIASHLDLNALHDLSRTCRQFRANLLEYRDQLVKHTLHCCNEEHDVSVQPRIAASCSPSRRLTSGRVGKCARDMVGECQRCATVVCRNCTMKPPPTPTLRARHRRLCRTCNKAPLAAVMTTTSVPSHEDNTEYERAFTAAAFERRPCNCSNVVWLCMPCGKDLRNADTMYMRAWSWRTRYTHYLGGVGTGAGEGNEAVECGRTSECLGAHIVEQETCEQETQETQEMVDYSSRRWRGTSYLAQEIEGIGGVLKVKHKKQVRVGECVKLYEDERDKAVQCLQREVEGKLRSWCSWCERIVAGEKDVC